MNKKIIAILGLLMATQVAFADPGRGSSGRPPQGNGPQKTSMNAGGSNGRSTSHGGGVGIDAGAGGSNG
ncbi:MAG: hypothetical protein JST16_01090 [Bdellovibrionales bacterium]|nr:hypothetical protein [Bdellovibrionales bacterium]